MTGDWKARHADDAFAAVSHELVQRVIREFADNMGFDPETGLPAYGIRKVAHYAAMVARAQALGFDPNLLRLTSDEATSAQLEMAARLVFQGVPVITVDPKDAS